MHKRKAAMESVIRWAKNDKFIKAFHHFQPTYSHQALCVSFSSTLRMVSKQETSQRYVVQFECSWISITYIFSLMHRQMGQTFFFSFSFLFRLAFGFVDREIVLLCY